jgi:predicted HTH domain antitoxin
MSIVIPAEIVQSTRLTVAELMQELALALFQREKFTLGQAKWYELGILSQGKAAEVAGLTRADFIAALSRFKVSVWQYTADELESELSGEDLCA